MAAVVDAEGSVRKMGDLAMFEKRAFVGFKDGAGKPLAKQPAERMTVDRIEGAVAVCELADGTLTNIPVAELPDGAYEGMVLKRGDCGWVPDVDEERSRRDRIQKKMDSLFV